MARAAVSSDVFAISPFAWGARAAVYGGRGQLGPFLAWLSLQWVAIGAAIAVSVTLIKRIYQGELKLGVSAARAATRARMWLPGATGALLEKDLRVAWRDPALKATLFMELAGPLVFYVIASKTGAFSRSGISLLVLATYVGMATFGSERVRDGAARRGPAAGLPASPAGGSCWAEPGRDAVRIPALIALTIAGALLAPRFLPAGLTIALSAMMVAAGADNYVSILFPVAAPEPGRSPHAAGSAGGRGLATALLCTALLVGAMLLASPFVLLAWLPVWAGELTWWWIALPLSLEEPARRTRCWSAEPSSSFSGASLSCSSGSSARHERPGPTSRGRDRGPRPDRRIAGEGAEGGRLSRDRRGHARPLAARPVRPWHGDGRVGLRAAARARTSLVLAAPLLANLRLLREAARRRAGLLVITDVSGAKRAICAEARRLGLRRFVGGHPMAGRERSGFAASSRRPVPRLRVDPDARRPGGHPHGVAHSRARWARVQPC